jgi:hypothetical protein
MENTLHEQSPKYPLPCMIPCSNSQQDPTEKPQRNSCISDSSTLLDNGVDIPDGGFRAWSIVIGSFLALFSTFGVVNAFVSQPAFYCNIGFKSALGHFPRVLHNKPPTGLFTNHHFSHRSSSDLHQLWHVARHRKGFRRVRHKGNFLGLNLPHIR